MALTLRGRGSVVAVVLAAVVALASCSAADPPAGSSSQPSPSPSGRPASPAYSGSPRASTPTDGSATPASPTPSDPPATPAPTTRGASDPAASCSGTAENRDFFATVAGRVSWDVYCAVVPDGWYVESGQWRLMRGGQLTVTYHGPNGAKLVLAEGVFCTDGASACQPMDRHMGSAAFGDLTGNMGSLGDGLVLYVDAGDSPAWQATATGLDQAAFVGLTTALVKVSG